MSKTLNLVSVVMHVSNQGSSVRRAVSELRAAFAGISYEVILVDDQSIDGSCHGMPREVLIIRTDRQLGSLSGLEFGSRSARGEVIIWMKPEAHFSPGSLRRLAEAANIKTVLLQTALQEDFNSPISNGGYIANSSRGLTVRALVQGPTCFPSVIGPNCAMNRNLLNLICKFINDLHLHSQADLTLSLICWYQGINIMTDSSVVAYYDYPKPIDDKVSYNNLDPCPMEVLSLYDLHSFFFPLSFKYHWKPLLDKSFLSHKPLDYDHSFRNKTQSIFFRSAVRQEEDFFPLVLDETVPCEAMRASSDEIYLRQQAMRSQPREYNQVRPRVTAALSWMFEQIPNLTLSDLSVLDLGSRDGFAVEFMRSKGAHHVEGVELIQATADYATSLGRVVRQGNMQNLDDRDETWDIVTVLHALEHCPNPKLAIGEISRVLKPAGCLFLSVPRRFSSHQDPCHNFAFPSFETLLNLVLTSGTWDPASIQQSSVWLDDRNLEWRLLIRK